MCPPNERRAAPLPRAGRGRLGLHPRGRARAGLAGQTPARARSLDRRRAAAIDAVGDRGADCVGSLQRRRCAPASPTASGARPRFSPERIGASPRHRRRAVPAMQFTLRPARRLARAVPGQSRSWRGRRRALAPPAAAGAGRAPPGCSSARRPAAGRAGAGRDAGRQPGRRADRCTGIGGGLALSGRIYAPLRRPAGAEAASGSTGGRRRASPVHLLAERRQALGREGRSAFALTLYGGASRTLPGGLRGSTAYAQAGDRRPAVARPLRRRSVARLARRSAGRGRRRRLGRGPARRRAARCRARASRYRLPVAARDPAARRPTGVPRRRRRRARLRPGAHPRRRFLNRAPSARPPFAVRVRGPWISTCRSRACR